MHSSTRRKRDTRRSSWASQGVAGMAVSAVVASGGDGGVRAGRTEEGESEREPDGSGGRVASSRRVEAEPGRQGGRRWPRRVAARVGHAPSPTGARRKATGERLVGWAASWAGQVAVVGAM